MIDLLVQCSTVALCPLDDVATCVLVDPKIRTFLKIFLGTFENAAPVLLAYVFIVEATICDEYA